MARSLSTAALTAALGLSACLLTAAPAQADTGAITGLAGKCLDVAGANSADGTPVQLYDCNGTNAQQWTVGT
ncbi:ricin-type beta-trefoil lectin domain protein, partial [Streptomyces sp. NPDC002078]